MSKVHPANSNKGHQPTENVVDKHKEKRGMTVNIPPDSSIDMFAVLSQVTIKVPLSELLRISEHRDKAIAWVGGVDKEVRNDNNENHTSKDDGHDDGDREPKVVVS